ncbi:PilZ domain-containing protein [Sphingomonas sp. MMS24-J13]|uniref:PilZ domain-containing protein n=1 Tax=Sphingomonas sp. MMS24-J13 TaxID=3238686 RepID=UPI00384E5A43
MDQSLTRDETDEEGGYANLRSAPRDSMFLMATVRRPGGQDVMVKVRNLSAGGMMAECPVGFARSELIEVDLRGIGRIAGTIAWSTGGRIGVSFAEPVDPRDARKPVASSSGAQPLLVKASRSMWRPGLKGNP